ncbi:MAG TPA: serine/threonine-protein kinase [Chthoniobacteraceae bacterium]|jgi:hypothetical protein|nr:serine/threonine-protein kinase [Chthoniobacteraceae bacterium]
MQVPRTEVIVSREGVELARRVVTPGEYVFGRGGDVDFPMETPLASRHHAKLHVNYDEWHIEDLASANGTFINGRRVPPNEVTRVFPTQSLRVGDATVTLRRLRESATPDVSLPPAAAAVHALLPEDLRTQRRYAIGQIVAQGGMGAILDARDQTIRRGVAMKVMLQSGDVNDARRFVEEAQITGQLEHPNIVPVYELGVDEQDQPFYTMKFVRGISLRKVLELLEQQVAGTVKKYPLGALLTIFQKVCNDGTLTLAADFWKKNGDRLARQVPMEKQLAKFRQRLIAEGNAPEKVPRWAFDAEGDLSVSIRGLNCSDISELRGVAVTSFSAQGPALRDLAPLRGAPLTYLWLHGTPVSDLTALAGAPITDLTVVNSRVTDISALRGLPLRAVRLDSTPIGDLAPLADIPTLELVTFPRGAKNIETLKRLTRLSFISERFNDTGVRPAQTAAEFWKEFDAKKAAPK